MPRKMTDTTPLKGIPSRVPVAGFRSPNAAQNPSRPNLIRTPGGRKDGGIKIIELSEQPLGFAAAKKRKRQQELEEQQKKAEQKQQSSATTNTISTSSTTATTTDVSSIITDYSPSFSTATIKEEVQDEKSQAEVLSETVASSTPISTTSIINSNKKFIKEEPFVVVPKKEKEDEDMIESASPLKSANLLLNTKQIKSEKVNASAVLKTNDSAKFMTITTSEKIKQPSNEQRNDPLINLPNNISVKITPTKQQSSSQNAAIVSGSSLVLKQTTPTSIKTIPITNQMKTGTGGPVIISQTIIQPATSKSANTSSSSGFVLPSNASIIRTTTAGGQSKIILAHSSQSNTVPSLTSLSQQSPPQTKIILKTSSGGLQPLVVTSRPQAGTNSQVNQPPPLISTNLGNRAVTIQPASQAAQQQHLLLQQQQQKQQEQNFTQVVMTSPNNNATGKGKTLYIPQKGIVLQNIGGDMYKQIPISNVSNLQTLTATSSNPPSLVQSLTTSANKSQQIPALIPSSNLPVVIQQQPQAVQTIISAVSIFSNFCKKHQSRIKNIFYFCGSKTGKGKFFRPISELTKKSCNLKQFPAYPGKRKIPTSFSTKLGCNDVKHT